MNDILDDVVVSREAFRLPAAERADYLQCACAREEVLRREIEA